MDLVTLGTILKNRIKECGYTQEDFAEKAGIGMSTLRKQINGTVAYRCDDLIKFAELLDCSYDYLLGYSSSTNRDCANIVDKTGLSEEAALALMDAQEKKNNDSNVFIQQIAKGMQDALNAMICDERFVYDMYLYIGCNNPLRDSVDKTVNKFIELNGYDLEETIKANLEPAMLALVMGDIAHVKDKLHKKILDEMRGDLKRVNEALDAIPTQTVVKANE